MKKELSDKSYLVKVGNQVVRVRASKKPGKKMIESLGALVEAVTKKFQKGL